MFAVFQLLPSFSVPARGTHNVSVTCCGSWPAMGSGTAGASRSLTEVYNQHLVINAPALRGGATTVGAWLNGDSNQYKVVKWLDGDAGTYWKISTNMAANPGGAAHGQLVTDFYIQALNDASGSLGGFRWLGTVRQPKYNNDTPAKNPYFFNTPNVSNPQSGMSWQSVGARGVGIVTTPLVWPYGSSYAFTVTSGNVSTTAANTLYQGNAGNGQVVPVLVQCSACPAGIGNNAIAFILTNGGEAHGFEFHSQGNGAGFSKIFLSGNGSGTIIPFPYQNNFLRITFANKDARYLFFQGTGTIGVDTTLRNQLDKTYWSSTGLIPPYDLTLTPANVPDPNWSYNWSPYSIGDFEQAQSAAGNQASIGPLPNNAVVDWVNQSYKTDKVIRAVGLSASLQIYDFKDKDTDTIVNLSANSYIGLPASVAKIVQWGGCSAVAPAGFTAPPGCFPIGYDTSISEHKPRYAAWAYLKTGELQYLDYQVEEANGSLLHLGTNYRNPIFPSSKTGVVTAWGEADQGEYRSIGWDLNDLEVAALIYPFDPTNPTALSYDGTQTGKYLNDLGDLSIQQIVDMFNPEFNAYDQVVFNGATTYSINRGFWTPYLGGLGYLSDGPEWEYEYVDFGFCWAAVRGNANAKTLLVKSGIRQNYIRTHFGGYHLYGYYERNGNDSATPHVGTIMNNSDHLFGIDGISAYNQASGNPTVEWMRGNPSFRLVGSPARYIPGNGDIIITQTTPGGFVQDSYTIRDYRSGSYNLYLTSDPTHTVVRPTNDGPAGPGSNFFRYRSVANLPPFEFPADAGYAIILRAGANWRQAILGGDANSAEVAADANRRLQKSVLGPFSTYFQGPRWSIQDHFGP